MIARVKGLWPFAALGGVFLLSLVIAEAGGWLVDIWPWWPGAPK